MKEIQSTTIEIVKKYEVEGADSVYFIKAVELLKEEYPEDKYRYTRHFQKIRDKMFMHVRIIFKNA